MRRIEGIGRLRSMVGEELGVSSWFTIDQDLIDRFGDITSDRQWLHVDPDRATQGPYGTTVAHGLLTLSLLPAMTADTFEVGGVSSRINYGYDRVRFLAPVPSGSRIRDRIVLNSSTDIDGGLRVHLRHTVEIEHADRPACVVEGITLLMAETA